MNKPIIEKGKPLVLPDGSKITKTEDNQTIVQSKEEQEAGAKIDELLIDPWVDDNVETYQRTLADINVDKSQFNPVMLVLSYSMWGLDEHAISRFLEVPIEQVQAIMHMELYTRTRQEMLEAIRYAEASSIHGYLSSQARNAAKTLAGLMTSKKEDIRLRASDSILDRSGHRPVDRVEHSIKFDDELRIVHLQQEKPVKIDVEI